MTDAVMKTSFSSIIDTPRKYYFNRLLTILNKDIDEKISILENQKKIHGDLLIIAGKFQSIPDIIQAYQFTKHLSEQATSLAELRVVRHHHDLENKTFEDVFETIRILSVFSG